MINLHCKRCNILLATDKDLAFYKDFKGGINLLVKNQSKKVVASKLLLKNNPDEQNNFRAPKILVCRFCNSELGHDVRAIDPERTGESVFCFKSEYIYFIEDSIKRYDFEFRHKWRKNDSYKRFTHIIEVIGDVKKIIIETNNIAEAAKNNNPISFLNFLIRNYPSKYQSNSVTILKLDAKNDDVKKAYKQAFLCYHPDKNSSSEFGTEWYSKAEEISKFIGKFYQNLK